MELRTSPYVALFVIAEFSLFISFFVQTTFKVFLLLSFLWLVFGLVALTAIPVVLYHDRVELRSGKLSKTRRVYYKTRDVAVSKNKVFVKGERAFSFSLLNTSHKEMITAFSANDSKASCLVKSCSSC